MLPQPATETAARASGPWCVIRDALSLVSYARNTGLPRLLADYGAHFEVRATVSSIAALFRFGVAGLVGIVVLLFSGLGEMPGAQARFQISPTRQVDQPFMRTSSNLARQPDGEIRTTLHSLACKPCYEEICTSVIWVFLWGGRFCC